jgi:hypothetical protein
MADETTKSLLIELVLENGKLKNGLAEANAELSKHEKKGKDAFGTLKAGWLAVAAAVAAVVAAVSASVRAYIEAEKAQVRLTSALRAHGNASKDTIDALNDQANALSRITKFEDDQITSLQGTFAQYGLNKAQIEKATKATLDFAEAKGMDLSTAGEIVGKSIATENNMLSRYSDIAVDATGKSARLDQVVAGLESRFKGAAEAAGDTMGGRLKILENNIGNIQEGLGEAVMRGIQPAVKALNEFFASADGADKMGKALRGIGIVVGVLGVSLAGMVRAWITAFSAAVDAVSSLSEVFKELFSDQPGHWKRAGEACVKFNGVVKDFVIDEAKIVGTTYKDAFVLVTKGMKEGEQAAEKLNTEVSNTGENVEAVAESVKKLNDEIGKLSKEAQGLSGTDAELAAIDEKIERVAELMRLETTSIEQRKKLEEALTGFVEKQEDIKLQARLKAFDDLMGQVSQAENRMAGIIDGIFNNILQNMEYKKQAATEALEATYDADKAALDDRLAKKAISQEDYDEQIRQLDAKRAADSTALEKKTARETAVMKRRQAEFAKAAAIIDSIINTARSVAAAYALSPGTFGLPWSAVNAGLGAAETAVIAAQPLPPVPAFASGGMIDSVALSHLAPSGEDGFIAARRGESVLNQQATAILGEDAINALNSGRQIGGNTIIFNIETDNGREIVDHLNSYFRQYGTSQRGVSV